jgi:hypothetical protein
MKNTEKIIINSTNFNSPLGVGGFFYSPFRGLGGIFFFLLLSISIFAQTPQTITFPDIQVKGYGDASLTLNATASSGLAVRYVSSDITVATVSGSTVTIKKTGAFTVISAYQDGNATFSAAIPVPQLLVLCPKSTLTVNADDKSVDIGTIPNLTFNISGYKKGETSSVLTGSPSFQAIVPNLEVGSYPIVINKGTLAATNYEFEMVNGTLTVLSKTVTPIVNAEDTLFKVYPNPCSNNITIENADKEHIVIVDVLGKKVLEFDCLGSMFNLDVSNISTGTYILKINKNNAFISNKIMINR